MDEELRNMIKENNKLLRDVVDTTHDTNVRIKKIHAIMKRTFWSRIAYWVLLLLITAGAFYAVIPAVNNLINKYSFINADFSNLGQRDSSEAQQFLNYFFSSEEVNEETPSQE